VRDLAGNQHLAIVLIALQGVVTIAPASAALTNILNAATYSTTIQTANSSSLLAALGVSYVMAEHWSARLDYLRIEHAGDSATTGKYNAAILAVGASYTF
jgi:opacity protein-like surface antigen